MKNRPGLCNNISVILARQNNVNQGLWHAMPELVSENFFQSRDLEEYVYKLSKV